MGKPLRMQAEQLCGGESVQNLHGAFTQLLGVQSTNITATGWRARDDPEPSAQSDQEQGQGSNPEPPPPAVWTLTGLSSQPTSEWLTSAI